MEGIGRLKNLIPEPREKQETNRPQTQSNSDINQQPAMPPSFSNKPSVAPQQPIAQSSKKPIPPSQEQQKTREMWAQEEKQRKEFLEKVQGQKEPPKISPQANQPSTQEIIRPVPAKPAFYEKIWARILSFVLVIAVAGGVGFFGYWLIIKPKPSPPPPPPPPPFECKTNSDCGQGKTCGKDRVCVKIELPLNIIIPPSLIFEDSVKNITFASPDDLASLLKISVSESSDTKKITRIVAIDAKKQQVAGIKTFFDNLRIGAPSDLYAKLENDATIFMYSSGTDNRIGLVAKIKDSKGLDSILKLWEKTMSTDFKPLFSTAYDQQTIAYNYFQTTKYRSANLRFQPFYEENLGTYYALFNGFFILASSRQSMEKIMDNITKTTTPAPPIISQRPVSFGRTVVKSRSITWIVVHSAYNTFENDPYGIDGMLREYKKLGAAPHYTIAKDGAIYQLVEDRNIAYHTAGYLTGTKTYINNISIGIEMIYKDNESPTKFQYQSLAQLVKYLQWKYNINQSNISSHSELVTGRDDPWNFSWGEFRSYLEQD